jgi:hypothetical protein
MPSPSTIKRLFAVSGNVCAFLGCTQPLIENNTVVGEMCHIKGERPKAARYDPQQTDQERDSFENIILVCGTHHTIVDGDVQTYTVERLTAMKTEHESKQTTRFAITDNLAIRLSLLGTGATLGALLGEIGQSLGGFRDLFSEKDPRASARPLAPAEIPAILRRVGPGTIGFAATAPLGQVVGRELMELFRREGWDAGQINIVDRLPIDVTKIPKDALVIFIYHPNESVFREAVGPVLSIGLSAMGFVPLEGEGIYRRGKSDVLQLLFIHSKGPRKQVLI